MNEAEWMKVERLPQAMVWALRGTKVTRTKAGKRKLRLFACACCRLVWGLLNNPLLRQSVEVAERFAEAQAGKDELAKAYESASGLMGMLTPDAAGGAASMAWAAAQPHAFSAALGMTAYLVPLFGSNGDWERERDTCLCNLLRCVFGNPFRLVTLNPAWLTPAVVSLAQAAYDERLLPSGHLDPARLAVLADALEEAGCMAPHILGHLRETGPHVRGCWVLDLLLGKE